MSRVCSVLGHLAPVHQCARSVCCVACAVSLATWLLLTRVPAWCVVLRVRRPRPLGPCSLVCPLGTLCCECGVPGDLTAVHWCARSLCPVCGVLGHLAPVHRGFRSLCCVACALSWATWLLCTDVPARRAVCAVSFATWLLFNVVPAQCSSLRLRCPWSLGSCSPVCTFGVLCVRCPCSLGSCSAVCLLAVLCCMCRVLGHFAPVHRFASLACCVCGVLGHLAPVQRCARSV